MNRLKRHAIFTIFRDANPTPATELEYANTFELLIAVMLSAQATDISVNRVTASLFSVADTPAAMLELGQAGLKRYIKSIGLYNNKAENIIKTCRLLVEQHDSAVPDSRKALEALPGVGRKTASVILNTAFGRPEIAVDTHIFRVSNRTGIATGSNVSIVEQKLLKYVPGEFRQNAHHWLLLHGRYVCRARKPDCRNCCINALCEWEQKDAFIS